MWHSGEAYGGQDMPAAYAALAARVCDVRLWLLTRLHEWLRCTSMINLSFFCRSWQAVLDGAFQADALDAFYALQESEGSMQVVLALYGDLFRLFMYGHSKYDGCMCADPEGWQHE